MAGPGRESDRRIRGAIHGSLRRRSLEDTPERACETRTVRPFGEGLEPLPCPHISADFEKVQRLEKPRRDPRAETQESAIAWASVIRPTRPTSRRAIGPSLADHLANHLAEARGALGVSEACPDPRAGPGAAPSLF
jgi:hypothetical protein